MIARLFDSLSLFFFRPLFVFRFFVVPSVSVFVCCGFGLVCVSFAIFGLIGFGFDIPF